MYKGEFTIQLKWSCHIPCIDMTMVKSCRSSTNNIVRPHIKFSPRLMPSQIYRPREHVVNSGEQENWSTRFLYASSVRGARVSSDLPRRTQSTFGDAPFIWCFNYPSGQNTRYTRANVPINYYCVRKTECVRCTLLVIIQ